MARRKQNVDMYGKSWSPIDLPNLEKAIKLYERLNYLQDHFASSLDGANAIMRQINETSEINEELKQMNIKLDKEQLKVLVQKLQTQKEENEAQNKANELGKQANFSIKTAQNPYNIEKKLPALNKPDTSLNWSNAGSNLANAARYNKALKTEMQALRDKGSILSDSGVRQMAESNLKYGKYNQETAKFIDSSAGKFGTAASILQVGAKAFQEGIEEFTSLMKTGITKQKQVYEDTFENISVRTGMTRSEYYDAQWKLNNELSEEGLRNNIGTSEIQKMWDSYATNGFDETTMLVNGIDSVLTNKIVPYLDTTTQESQLLNQRLNGDFYKQIRGIAQANMDLAGGNYATQEILNTMIDKITPMSDEALQNLTLGSSEMSRFVNDLIDEGLTKDQAVSMATQLYKQQEYGDEILRSGNIAETLSYINVLERSDLSLYNPDNYVDIAAINGSTRQELMATSPGYTSTMNGLTTNIMRNAYGIDYQDALAALKLNEKNINLYDKAESASLTEEELQNYADQATKDYTDDKNQTNSTLQEITVENLMNELAVVDEWMSHWAEVIEAAIKGLGTLITGYLGTKIIGGVIGKGIGALSGTGSSGGLFSLLGSAGPIAAGIGGVALGVAAGVAVAKGIRDKALEGAAEDNDNSKARADMQARGLAEDLDISEGTASLMLAGSNIYNNDENWLGVKFDNYDAAELFGAQLGIFDTLDEKDFIQTMDKSTKKSDTLTYNKAKIGRSLLYKGLGTTPSVLSNIAQAWMIGLYSQGYDGKNSNVYQALADTLNIGAFTPDKNSISELLESERMTRSQYKFIVDAMTQADMWLWNDNGKWVMPNMNDYEKALNDSSLSDEDKEWLNSHKSGLSNVPYDNYPALLHEGEAVLTKNAADLLRLNYSGDISKATGVAQALTEADNSSQNVIYNTSSTELAASTAYELRNLINEYRQNSNSMAGFEAVIQTQTATLVEKMDQIIENMKSGTPTSNENLSEAYSQKRNVLASMVSMTSTKAAFSK